MADKTPDMSAATDRVRVAKVSQDRVSLEFQIEDLIQHITRQVQVASCMGCKGCMSSSF